MAQRRRWKYEVYFFVSERHEETDDWWNLAGDMICITQNKGDEAINVREQFKEGQWNEVQAMLGGSITTI